MVVLSLTLAGFWSLAQTRVHAWDEINDTPPLFLERPCPVLLECPGVLLQMGASTQKGIRGAQRGRQMKWSARQSAALTHKPQQLHRPSSVPVLA